ncbi:MAG TPA: hypothetical protein VH539_02690 [Gemmatimonadaceae bacterium]
MWRRRITYARPIGVKSAREEAMRSGFPRAQAAAPILHPLRDVRHPPMRLQSPIR